MWSLWGFVLPSGDVQIIFQICLCCNRLPQLETPNYILLTPITGCVSVAVDVTTPILPHNLFTVISQHKGWNFLSHTAYHAIVPLDWLVIACHREQRSSLPWLLLWVWAHEDSELSLFGVRYSPRSFQGCQPFWVCLRCFVWHDGRYFLLHAGCPFVVSVSPCARIFLSSSLGPIS